MSRTRTVAMAALLALGASLAGVFALAAPASAHITVNPREAQQGGYARVAFRVPTESDTASTTKVEVVLPADNPIASVSTMPVPGWTVKVERAKLATPLKDDDGNEITEAASKITWTATGDAAVKPGQFQEFPVSMGPLPKTDKLVFKALQTYSDGNVIRWIEEPADGAEEPEHPAMVLKLVAAAAPAGSATASPGAAGGSSDSSDDSSGVALALGIAGLVAGLAGAVLGGLALARSRRPA